MLDYLILGMRYGILAVGCIFVFALGLMVIGALIGVINGIIDAFKNK